MAHRHCLTCVNANCLMPECETICAMAECVMKCGAKFHNCKSVDHRQICQNELVPCINKGNGCSAVMPRWMTGKHLENCPACVVACMKCCGDQREKPFKSHKDHRLVQNSEVISGSSSDAGVAINSAGNVITYPPFFRRDEVKNHILNTHNFVMSNVTGPIVESCPLSNLGCDFRFSRCRLVTPDYHKAYAPLLNVIGFRNESKDGFEPDQGTSQYPSVSLTELPVDVLLIIFGKLDNFSLICMSLTCKLFRDFSSHRLKQSGIVFRRWRKSSDSAAKWISTKKWRFSTVFGSSRLRCEQYKSNQIAIHLKECPYNKDKNQATEPFNYGIINDDILKVCKYQDCGRNNNHVSNTLLT